MLSVENLQAAYGSSKVLFGMELSVEAGSVVSLLGRNGMGKTTTIRTITGMMAAQSGEIEFLGQSITGSPSFAIARMGMGLVPEGRQVFPNLTTYENLVATAANRRDVANPWNIKRIFEMFPELESRRSSMANLLSGGEQQMLAIGRALLTNPALLILDEATEGLAPMVRETIWDCLKSLKAEGLSILVVDKNIADLLKLADRHIIIEKGVCVWNGTSAELAADPALQERYLGV